MSEGETTENYDLPLETQGHIAHQQSFEAAMKIIDTEMKRIDDQSGGGGSAGDNGWSPVLAVATDGERRVFYVSDWVGGEGTKPAIGEYVGPTGLVELIGDGMDIRGPIGETGEAGAPGTDGADGDQGPPGNDGNDGAPGADGADGADGDNGWTPVLGVDTDGARRVSYVTDWIGGEGTKPEIGQYVGPTGFVETAAEAVDIRGPAGANGADGNDGEQGPPGADGEQGPPGNDGEDGAPGTPGADGSDGDSGWSPVLGIESDGERRVAYVTDWVGGEGTKPATGEYIGPTGLVSTVGAGVDIRGPAGADGVDGTDGTNGADGAPGADGADGVNAIAAFVLACSDETSDLEVANNKIRFRAPYAFLLTGVRASVNEAPTGSEIEIDVKKNGTSVFTTLLTIDATETTSQTAAVPAVIDATQDDIAVDDLLSVDLTQVGSTDTGVGLKVTLLGTFA